MTINELTIDDAIAARFKATCTEQYQRGGPRVCQKARTTFFSDLKLQYSMDRITPHLRDLFVQLERWEVDTRANGT